MRLVHLDCIPAQGAVGLSDSKVRGAGDADRANACAWLFWWLVEGAVVTLIPPHSPGASVLPWHIWCELYDTTHPYPSYRSERGRLDSFFLLLRNSNKDDIIVIIVSAENGPGKL